jgi:hypothetical protein
VKKLFKLLADEDCQNRNADRAMIGIPVDCAGLSRPIYILALFCQGYNRQGKSKENQAFSWIVSARAWPDLARFGWIWLDLDRAWLSCNMYNMQIAMSAAADPAGLIEEAGA